MKFKVHPLFFALALVLVLTGQALGFVWTLVAVLLHEAGHALAARTRGYAVKQVVLLPFGAAMSAEEELDGRTGAVVGAAGPAVSLAAALMTAGVWWLFPAVYPYTRAFLFANLTIGLFNLLPVYPLDGSMVVLSRTRNRLRALKIMQAAGIVVSMVFFALFVVSVFFGMNFTFCVIAVFLFYGATAGSREASLVSVLSAQSKKYMHGVVRKRVAVSRDIPLARLFHHIDSRSETVFEVVDTTDGDAPVPVGELTEENLRVLAARGRLSRTLRDSETESASAAEKPVRGTRKSAGSSAVRQPLSFASFPLSSARFPLCRRRGARTFARQIRKK